MLTNFLVKQFLNQLISGAYIRETSTIAFYPTINVRKATVTAKTADYTVTLADLALPTIFTNAAAGGTIVLSLPSVASSIGKVVRATTLAAQILRLLPKTGEIINLNGSVVVTKYLNIPATIGDSVELFCDGKQWVVTKANGIITKEP